MSDSKLLGCFALINLPLPFLAATFGWLFTEMGRQPWIVVPNLLALQAGDLSGSVLLMTDAAISPNVSAGEMLATLIGFTLLYAVLGVIWFLLMRRYALEGIHTSKKQRESAEQPVAADLSFGY